MAYLVERLRSRIRNKIILPYLLLALIVVVVGSGVAFLIVAGSLQERLEQRLRQSALDTTQALVEYEDQMLSRLRPIAANGPNAQQGLLSTADAVAKGEQSQLEKILRNGLQFYQMSYLSAFDAKGNLVAQAQREGLQGDISNLRQLSGVEYILSNKQDLVDGVLADKYTSIMLIQSPNLGADPLALLYTTVPLRQRDMITGEERLVGGLIAAEPLQSVLAHVQRRNDAFYTIFYDDDGRILASSAPAEEAELALPGDSLLTLRGQVERDRALRTTYVNKREFLFAFSPLRIRTELDGYFGVAVENSEVLTAWLPTRNLILMLTLVVLLGVAGVGHLVALRITRPLQELADTARAIAQGRLSRRSTIKTSDEVGTLAAVLNQMTDRLLDLYRTSRALGADLEQRDIINAAQESVSRALAGGVVGVVLQSEGQWHLHTAEETRPAPLSGFEQEQIDQLPLFGEAELLGALMSQPALRALGPRWVLPLVTQQRTVGLLLVGSVPADLEAEPIREPLIAIASMTATALQNALLYADVEQEARQNKAILQSIVDGVIVCAPGGTIILANPAALEMLGFQQEEQLSDTLFADLPLEPINSTEPDAGRLYQVNERVLSLSSSPVISYDGRLLGEVIVLHDITARQELDRAKTDFIATVSHELRTPLTPIMGYLDLMLQPSIGGELSEEQGFFLRTIKQHVDTISGLLNNVLVLASIEAGTLKSDPQPYPLPRIVDELLLPVRRSIDEKGLTLTLDVPQSLPQVRVDQEQLRIALSKLLDNALRYTERGSITIQARGQGDHVQVDISDTGPGIPPEDQQRLFTRFNRGGEQRGLAVRERGAGLGLAIARQLIERQGGTIWVRSDVGHGSTFSFTLPRASEDQDAISQPQQLNSLTTP